jgi:NitT/TauT family transport system substrate-binding protein
MKRLLLGRCDLINARADDVMVAFSRGMPLRFAGVTMQHNPQAILSHRAHAITDFRQLDGRRIMVDVSAPWVDFIERRYDIRVQRMPHNFGLSHYLNDERFIMQCFLTNEPYYVEKAGADPVVLPMWESGYDTYRGVVVTDDTWGKRPEAVRAFMAATREAWADYLYGDPSPAHQLIASRNPQMTAEFMDFIRSQLLEHGIIDGRPSSAANIGRLETGRLEVPHQALFELGVIEKKVDFEVLFPTLADSVAPRASIPE